MAFKVYLTIELPGDFTSEEYARAAAIRALQEHVRMAALFSDGMAMVEGKPINATVYPAGRLTAGDKHSFLIDIHDGAI